MVALHTIVTIGDKGILSLNCINSFGKALYLFALNDVSTHLIYYMYLVLCICFRFRF